MSECVAQYFERVLKAPLVDDQGLTAQKTFTVETVCGRDCRTAIDQGAIRAGIAQRKMQGQPLERELQKIRKSVTDKVLEYVYG